MTHLCTEISRQPAYWEAPKILSRQEAEQKLQTLIPGSEESRQLKDALVKTHGLAEVILPHSSYKVYLSKGGLLGGFGSSEHMAIGEQVLLEGLSPRIPLLIKGMTPLRFEHIVALAGDFYGVVDAPISLLGGTDEEKATRFMAAFNTLWETNDHQQVRLLLQELDNEYEAVKHSGLPHHCYSHRLIESNSAVKKIKSDVDKLLIDNSDHFSTNAKDAYRVGHHLAREAAQIAGQTGDREGLKRAYAIEAFACHFLTDLFAAGHIRNQRGELESFLFNVLHLSPQFAKSFAGILTAAQHEHDGHQGLNVSNDRGDQWRAYGDGFFFTPKNELNRQKVEEAVHQSASEIYSAYIDPSPLRESSMNQWIPHPTPFNPPPLYSVEHGTLRLLKGGEIASKADYLLKGIPLALEYLPESYVNGFINEYLKPDVEVPEILKGLGVVVNQVLVPRAERLTSTLWHVIGIATYHQVKQSNQLLNAKADEIGDMLKATYENTARILKELGNIRSQLDDILKNQVLQPIQTYVTEIDTQVHQFEYHGWNLKPHELVASRHVLWDAYLKLSQIFLQQAPERILSRYETFLDGSLSPPERKIGVTHWFRRMLDYQVQAFALWMAIDVIVDHPTMEGVRGRAAEFHKVIEDQLRNNEDLIDGSLVCESHSYIALQLKKAKTQRLAIEFLK